MRGYNIYKRKVGFPVVRLLRRRGSFLVEASIALFLLVAIAFVLVEASLNMLQPRSWVMKQNLADAYLSKEVALMNRVDFDSIVDGSSSWGSGTMVHVGAAPLQIGTLPGFVSTDEGGVGRSFTANVYRMRLPLETSTSTPSFQVASGANVLSLSDLGIRAYKLQSHVVFSVDNGATQYVKTRTVVRSQ